MTTQFIRTPITISNTQPQPTSANFQQLIQVPIPQYLNGVRFWSPTDGWLHAWLENISNGTATMWVKIPSSIPANGTYQLYMMQDSTLPMDGVYWGEAPQLSSTYAQYDNGASVFGAYDNFAGTTLSSQWTEINSPTLTINNGITVAGNGQTGGIYLKTKYSLPAVLEAYTGNWPYFSTFAFINDINGGPYTNTGYIAGGTGTGEAYNALMADPIGANPTGSAFQYWLNGGFYPVGPTLGSIIQNNIVSIYSSGSTIGQLINYGSTSSVSASVSLPSTTYNIEIFASSGNSIQLHWIRYRAYPPNGVMPSASFGASQYSGELITVTVP